MIKKLQEHKYKLMAVPLVALAVIIAVLIVLNIRETRKLRKLAGAKVKAPVIRTAEISGGMIHIVWDQIPGASDYELTVYAEDGSTVQKREKTGNVGTCTTKADSANGSFTIRPYFGKQAGKVSKKKDAIGEAPRIGEVEAKADGSFNEISLSWTMYEDSEPGEGTFFRIYRKKAAKGQTEKMLAEGLSEMEYLDETAECGANYRYRVEPYDVYPDTTITGSPIPSGFVRTEEKKADVASLKNVTSGVYGTIKRVPGATCYRVFRRLGTAKKWAQMIVVGSPEFFDADAEGPVEYRIVPGREFVDGTVWGNKGGKTKSIRAKKKKKTNGLVAGSNENLSAFAVDGAAYTTDDAAQSSLTTPETPLQDTEGRHPLMGTSGATAQQMVSYYKSIGGSYPSVYASKGAATIDDFCEILVNLCSTYGIRAEYVFAQVCVETGNLSFSGSSVSAKQCNFSGLGATGGGASGNSFSSVEEGLKAQIQHLRLYADPSYRAGDDNVDKRYDESLAGSAPYVEWLEMGKNPNGAGWAAGSGYADQLLSIADKIRSS